MLWRLGYSNLWDVAGGLHLTRAKSWFWCFGGACLAPSFVIMAIRNLPCAHASGGAWLARACVLGSPCLKRSIAQKRAFGTFEHFYVRHAIWCVRAAAVGFVAAAAAARRHGKSLIAPGYLLQWYGFRAVADLCCYLLLRMQLVYCLGFAGLCHAFDLRRAR